MSNKFKKDDVIIVYNLTLTGRKFKEGIAQVVRKEKPEGSFYLVRFVGHRGLYSRDLKESEFVK